jgi:hypothetical protein
MQAIVAYYVSVFEIYILAVILFYESRITITAFHRFNDIIAFAVRAYLLSCR